MSDTEQFDRLTDILSDSRNGNRLALGVLRHHRPRGRSFDFARCEGCDMNGGDAPVWPCSTVRLLANYIGAEGVLGDAS